jgi:hypothetical protein
MWTKDISFQRHSTTVSIVYNWDDDAENYNHFEKDRWYLLGTQLLFISIHMRYMLFAQIIAGESKE